MENNTTKIPAWAQGRRMDEQGFCQDFCKVYPLLYAEGAFFTWRGMEPDSRVKKWIYDYIKPYYRTDLTARVNRLLDNLKMELQRERLPYLEDTILCYNGVYDLVSSRFYSLLDPCHCRLPVDYNPRARKPETWLAFLQDLLEEEDILTLQEFMGYCLLPVNYAQKMLLIIGRGGEGKSRIGIIASKLFGETMVNGSLPKLEKNQFARADLQHKLLMVDDDLQMEALHSTGIIKSIITAEQPKDLERKGIQSYQGKMFCRLMAFGNGNLRALHDRSHGFFRRQIILTTRPRPENRVDDPFLVQKMEKELEGIFLWCIEGLERLRKQNYHFTLSSTAKANLREAIREGNNTVEFLQAEDCITLDPYGEISTRRLYAIYTDWCADNMLTALSCQSFSAALQSDADRYGITYSNRIDGGNGKLVRGFRGIRAVSQF